MSEKRVPEVLLHLRTTTERLHFQTAIAAAVAVFLSCPFLTAQTAPSPSTQTPTAVKAHRHAKPSPAQPAGAQEQPPVPPQPEVPHWPVNDIPAKPSVTWDSQGLKIDATNASLHEILNDVSNATGAKVEGFGNDERVFGEYGPGQTRDVISQLLHGSGYNVLMIGDQGEGTPRQIVLSARKAASNQPGANRNTQEMPDDDTPDQPEVEEQPPQQPPLINGHPPAVPVPQGPPGSPRTPQQILQELQQRQQQMQDQQQQQQQPQ